MMAVLNGTNAKHRFVLREEWLLRAVLSIVLAGLLVTTPLKLVLAQTAQQEAVSVQQTASPDSKGHRLIGVPPVRANTSRLWRNPADRARLNTELSDGFFVQRGERTAAQAAIAAVVIAVGLLILVVIIKKVIGAGLE